jgi:transposase
VRELDRLGEDLAVLDREIAEATVDDPAVRRLLTIAWVNVTVAAGLVAAIGDIGRFSSPQQLVSYVGLNPRVRQSGLGLAQHGRISKIGRSHARALLVAAAWAAAKVPGPLKAFSQRIRAQRGHRSPPSRPHARWRSSSDISWPRRPTISGRGRRWSPTSCVRSSCRPAGR